MKKQAFWTHLATALTLAILGGALAGVVAAIVVNEALDQYLLSLQDDRTILQLTEVEREPLPGTYEEALSQLHESLWSSMVFVFTPGMQQQWEDVQAMGIVMTSDGWLLFHEDAFVYGSALNHRYVINDEIYEAVEVQADTMSNAVMVRVEAQGLTSVAIGKTKDYLGGEMIFAPLEQWALLPSVVTSAHHYQDALATNMQAEVMTQQWQLEGMDELSTGVAFDPSGDLVAVLGVNEVIAVHELVPFISSVLRDGFASHAGLGMMIEDGNRFIDDRPVTIMRIVSEGPADLAGLEVGDEVLALNGERIDRQDTFAELLAQYRPDDQVVIEYRRQDDIQSVTVDLGTYEDLLY